MSARTYTLSMPYGEVPVTVTERGAGAPVLLLHGGAGPDSFAGFADELAARFDYRVLTPVNPGFGGTPRPEGLDSVRKLAEVYARLLAELDLTGVIVAGNSIGGWIAAELALAAPDRVARLFVIDGAGLVSADHPAADFPSLTLDQVTEFSWANPEGHRIDLSALTDAQRAIFGGNRAALAVYGGPSMADPSPGRSAVRHHGRHAGGLGRGGPDGHPRVRQGVRGRDPGRVLPPAAGGRAPAAAGDAGGGAGAVRGRLTRRSMALRPL